MRFEGEDVPEKRLFLVIVLFIIDCLKLLASENLPFSLLRFTGTITGIGDISSQWPCSKWRSLKVHH